MKKTLLLFVLTVGTLALRAQSAEEYLKSAIDKQNSGDNEGAIADCNKALEKEPNNVVIFNVRGLSNYNLHKYEEAIDDYSRTIPVHATAANAIAFNYRGSAKYYLGNYDEALKDFNMAIRLLPKYESAYNNKANTEVMLQMPDDAINDFNNAININPLNAAAYNNRAYVKNTMKQYADAMSDCRRALQLSSDPKIQAGAYRNLGFAEIGLNNYDQGIIDCTRAINLDMENAKAYNYRGYAYFKQGKYDLAVADDKATTDAEKDGEDFPWEYGELANKKLKYMVAKPAATPAASPATTPNSTVLAQVVAAPAKSNMVANNVNYVWLSPTDDLSNLPDGVLKLTESADVTVKIRVVSNAVLDKTKFHLYVNGQDFSNGNKMRVAGIEELKQKSSFSTYNYVANIRVPLGKSAIKLVYDDAPPSEELTVEYTPADISLHVLAIGTHSPGLKYPEKDASDFAGIFAGQKGDNKLFHNVSVDILKGDSANARSIADKVAEWSNKRYSDRDVLILFISSHGLSEDGRLLITGSDYKSTAKKFTTVDFKGDIMDQLEGANCKKFVFIDACHSGAGISGGKATQLDITNAINQMASSGNSTTIITSSSSSELSWEDDSWGNGAFTKAIKEALQDMKADKDGNGIVSMDELYDYITNRIAELIRLAGKKDENGNAVTQTPKMWNPRGNVGIYAK